MIKIIMSTFAVLAAASSAIAQPVEKSAATGIEKLSGFWVEGPGFDIKYGASYEVCSQRCLDLPKCVMIEYYRPEKKCNMYDTVRPRLTGGASIVGIKRTR
jgi:hypothetical protein